MDARNVESVTRLHEGKRGMQELLRGGDGKQITGEGRERL